MANVGLPPDHPPQTNRISCGIRGRAIGFCTTESFQNEKLSLRIKRINHKLDEYQDQVRINISMFR